MAMQFNIPDDKEDKLGEMLLGIQDSDGLEMTVADEDDQLPEESTEESAPVSEEEESKDADPVQEEAKADDTETKAEDQKEEEPKAEDAGKPDEAVQDPEEDKQTNTDEEKKDDGIPFPRTKTEKKISKLTKKLSIKDQVIAEKDAELQKLRDQMVSQMPEEQQKEYKQQIQDQQDVIQRQQVQYQNRIARAEVSFQNQLKELAPESTQRIRSTFSDDDLAEKPYASLAISESQYGLKALDVISQDPQAVAHFKSLSDQDSIEFLKDVVEYIHRQPAQPAPVETTAPTVAQPQPAEPVVESKPPVVTPDPLPKSQGKAMNNNSLSNASSKEIYERFFG